MGLGTKIAVGLLMTGATAAGVSQLPEAYDCKDSMGIDSTEWIHTEVGTFPSCDEEYMTEMGNRVHDIGEAVAIISGAGVVLMGAGIAIIELDERGYAKEKIPSED